MCRAVRSPHRVLEKAGYEREGVLRTSAIKEGRILDEYLYARVNPAVG